LVKLKDPVSTPWLARKSAEEYLYSLAHFVHDLAGYPTITVACRDRSDLYADSTHFRSAS
jgi:hypothetical protein